MMGGYYILDGHTAVPADVLTWGRWLEEHTADRIVKKTTVGESEVSTVFLGLDHSFGEGPRHIFETMVFGGDHDQLCERYATWDQAEKGHEDVVRLVKGGVSA